MKRFLAVLLVLLPTVALAQDVPALDVPADARMDMWCGTAFDLMTRDAPADDTPQKRASAALYADGGQFLLQRAIPIFLESGYSDEALAAYRAKLDAAIGRAINGSGGGGVDATYSFQECSALIGQ